LDLVFWNLLPVSMAVTHLEQKMIGSMNIVSFFKLALLIKPIILFSAVLILNYLIPQYYQSLSHLPFWALLLIVSIPDDFSQYWWHRKSHE